MRVKLSISKGSFDDVEMYLRENDGGRYELTIANAKYDQAIIIEFEDITNASVSHLATVIQSAVESLHSPDVLPDEEYQRADLLDLADFPGNEEYQRTGNSADY